ncbi:hypothetical protein L9F63_017828 [Diploptera punctata]|uniref:C-type lectin domain-containing protein n=1 Tax=Diploptera punctata TaxID=6984 RepID=A0AAD7ZY46_DIPPU|nr:hypothetical protein L9F63_017828 [Diploptera punctata]
MAVTRGEITYVYRVNNTFQNWHQAFESCYNMAWGSKLAILDFDESEAEENIVKILPELDPSMCYYVGYHDLFYEGHFLDIEGRELRYTKWFEGQPDNRGGDENCVSLINGLKLADTSCHKPNCYAICMEPET